MFWRGCSWCVGLLVASVKFCSVWCLQLLGLVRILFCFVLQKGWVPDGFRAQKCSVGGGRSAQTGGNRGREHMAGGGETKGNGRDWICHTLEPEGEGVYMVLII